MIPPKRQIYIYILFCSKPLHILKDYSQGPHRNNLKIYLSFESLKKGKILRRIYVCECGYARLVFFLQRHLKKIYEESIKKEKHIFQGEMSHIFWSQKGEKNPILFISSFLHIFNFYGQPIQVTLGGLQA